LPNKDTISSSEEILYFLLAGFSIDFLPKYPAPILETWDKSKLPQDWARKYENGIKSSSCHWQGLGCGGP
jgi:hypothetical protein